MGHPVNERGRANTPKYGVVQWLAIASRVLREQAVVHGVFACRQAYFDVVHQIIFHVLLRTAVCRKTKQNGSKLDLRGQWRAQILMRGDQNKVNTRKCKGITLGNWENWVSQTCLKANESC